jgi:hypothetical protein
MKTNLIELNETFLWDKEFICRQIKAIFHFSMAGRSGFGTIFGKGRSVMISVKNYSLTGEQYEFRIKALFLGVLPRRISPENDNFKTFIHSIGDT